MKDRGLITMSLREVDRFKVIQAAAEGLLPQWRAAERLNLTTRQVRRLVQRWRVDGPTGLLSRQRGQPGHRQLPRMLEAQARALIQAQYADYGPTLAAEKLRERHGVDLAKETVRRSRRLLTLPRPALIWKGTASLWPSTATSPACSESMPGAPPRVATIRSSAERFMNSISRASVPIPARPRVVSNV